MNDIAYCPKSECLSPTAFMHLYNLFDYTQCTCTHVDYFLGPIKKSNLTVHDAKKKIVNRKFVLISLFWPFTFVEISFLKVINAGFG